MNLTCAGSQFQANGLYSSDRQRHQHGAGATPRVRETVLCVTARAQHTSQLEERGKGVTRIPSQIRFEENPRLSLFLGLMI